MSTATKQSVLSSPSKPPTGAPKNNQLHKDRVTFGIVVALVGLLIGLLVWLASISPGLESGDFHYWMP